MSLRLDMTTARLVTRRDGIPCYVIEEPAPSVVVHLFHPSHPDYNAARLIHKAKEEDHLAEQAEQSS